MKEPSEIKYDCEKSKDLIGKIVYHEQLHVFKKGTGMEYTDSKKVYILLTGGTIGMFANEAGKYAPAREKFLSFLKEYKYFCDEDETYFNGHEDLIITPPSIGGNPISFHYDELSNLIDSTNMSIDRMNIIMNKIKSVYDKYDAFVILHGTDTMAYTASALSFMIENLKKTVIVTGSQIPICEARNDGVNNLLSALTIAGHYLIPEVLLIFDNKILRGNRSTKWTTASFDAFKSPNFYPLGELGLTINIKWEKIIPCNQEQKTNFVEIHQPVEIQKLTPYGYTTHPSSRFVVIESYGIGNIPTEGPFIQMLRENSKLPENERKILVNISQVFQSSIKNSYETGQMAYDLGMIPGSDMTCEAAIAKLSYLIAKGYHDFNSLSEMMGKNLRGELTEEEDRFTSQKENYTLNCMTVLDRNFYFRTKKEKEILTQIIFPTIILEKPSKAIINRLQQYNDFDPHKVFPDGSNIMHRLMRANHSYSPIEYDSLLETLLKLDVKIDIVDKHGNSAAFYGIENHNYEAVNKIMERGAIMKTTAHRIFKAITSSDIELLHGLSKFEYKFDEVNSEGRNCGFFLVINKIKGKDRMISFFKEFTKLFDQEGLKVKDLYGKSLMYYLDKFELRDIVEEDDKYIEDNEPIQKVHESPRNSTDHQKQASKELLQGPTSNIERAQSPENIGEGRNDRNIFPEKSNESKKVLKKPEVDMAEVNEDPNEKIATEVYSEETCSNELKRKIENSE